MPCYLVLFILVYVSREMGSSLQGNETKVVPVKSMTHVSHYTALLTCAQVVGKFRSHNPEKLHMCQISYKNYILEFPED